MRNGNAGLSSAATEQEQERFFHRVQSAYSQAVRNAGEVVRHFRVAGTRVRLRFAGGALIPTIVPGLVLPVAAFEDGAGEGDTCEICIWDSASTGVPLTPRPRAIEDLTGRGNIWGFDSPRYRSAYQWGEGSVSVMDRQWNRAVYWVPSHEHLPAWVMSSPLRTILHWWLEKNGRQLVHAAALGHNGRGVLIPARGGSGKSSTALACLIDGLDFLSDDYVAVAMDPEPTLYRLYSTAKLDPRSLELYPALANRCRTVFDPGFEKTVLFLEEGLGRDGYGAQMRESLPLSLVLKPSISGKPETIGGPVEPWEIECGIASETLAHLPHTGAHTIAMLERISHEVPHSAIHLGTERARIPDFIRRLLERERIPPPMPTPRAEQPVLSLIVHFRNANVDALRALAQTIEEQFYRRAELLVLADGGARALQADIAKLPLTSSANVLFFAFDDSVPRAAAWNKGVREAFGELLLFLEPEDRFMAGTFEALASACVGNPEVSVFRGHAEFAERQENAQRPLAGAVVRKDLFRRHGLFDTRPVLEGRAEHDWLEHAIGEGAKTHLLDRVTLGAGTNQSDSGPGAKLRLLKYQLDRRRAAGQIRVK